MATSGTARGRVLLPGPSVSLLQNLSGVPGWPWQENPGDPATRATGGGLVLVCNLDLDLWIWGYLYGYVCMSHYITPVGRPAFPVGKFCNSLTDPRRTLSDTVWGYIPAGLRPIVHTRVYSVK